MFENLKQLFFKQPLKHEYILDLRIPENRRMFEEAKKNSAKHISHQW